MQSISTDASGLSNAMMEQQLFSLGNPPVQEETKVSEPMYQRLLTEYEWRRLNLTMTRGWQHFMVYPPEPWVLLFRRQLGTDPQTGLINLLSSTNNN